jgi:hypothetical protein
VFIGGAGMIFLAGSVQMDEEITAENLPESAGIDLEFGDYHRRLNIPESIREVIGGDLVTQILRNSNQGGLVLSKRSMLDMPVLPDRASRTAETEEFYPMIGLAEVLLNLASRRGTKISPPWLPVLPLPRPELTHLVNPAAGRFIESHNTGLIEIGHGVTTAEILIDICRAYPTTRVLVLGAHIAPLSRLCRSVSNSQSGISAGDLSRGTVAVRRGRLRWVDTSQLIFSTYTNAILLDDFVGLPYTCFPIIVCLQPQLIRAEQNVDFLLGPNPRYRLYGILPADHKLADTDSDQLVNVFGIRRLRLPASGSERTAVNWIAIRNIKAPRNFDSRARVSENIQRLHSCSHRNRLLGDLAIKLTGPEWRSCDGLIGAWLAAEDQSAAPPLVVVAADGENQIRNLKKLLTDWPVVDSSQRGTNLADWRSHSTGDGRSRGIICRADSLVRLASDFEPAVIIHAVGRPDALSLPQRWLQHPAAGGTRSRRLIIDFFDRATDLTKEWSRVRLSEYVKKDIYKYNPERDNEIQFHDVLYERFISRAFRPAQKAEG